jgi:hypothetical protein
MRQKVVKHGKEHVKGPNNDHHVPRVDTENECCWKYTLDDNELQNLLSNDLFVQVFL